MAKKAGLTRTVRLLSSFEIKRSGQAVAGVPKSLTHLPEGRYRPPTRLEAMRPGCPNVTIREGSQWDLTPAAVRANRKEDARRAEAERQRIARMPVSERKAFLDNRRRLAKMNKLVEQLSKEAWSASRLAKRLEKQALRAFVLFIQTRDASQSSQSEGDGDPS